MIPKIIHYCWFGDNPMPANDAAYVEGWKSLLPDYQFMHWNEKNFDLSIVRFTEQVASVKKWGFIVDYIRAWAVYNYGGIYLDTDVELLKHLDIFLDNVCFSGFENGKYINPGNIFAGEKGCRIAKEVMDFYASYKFINKNGKLNLTPSPKILTSLLLKYGLKQNGAYQTLGDGIFTAYPFEYFCPIDFTTGKSNITRNTHSIHHFAMSWFSDFDIFLIARRRKIIALMGDSVIVKVILLIINFYTRCARIGIRDTLSYYISRYIKKN
jgi:hypothetical protein